MDDLNRALGDIRNIRRQVAQSTEFRGYGPLTLCATAALAILGGMAQAIWVQQPGTHPLHYAAVWSVTAILSLALIATQTLTRAERLHAHLAGEMIRMAAEQFLPAAVAGTLLTVLVVRSGAPIIWLLPGLWQIVYSLGIFASSRFMPRNMLAAGAWYLLTGLRCVSLGDARALSPVVMAGAYGLGQCLIAGILHLSSWEAADGE